MTKFQRGDKVIAYCLVKNSRIPIEGTIFDISYNSNFAHVVSSENGNIWYCEIEHLEPMKFSDGLDNWV